MVIADELTASYKPHEYGKVILPLTVIRRFDNILTDNKAAVLSKFKEVKDIPMLHCIFLKGWYF